MKKFNLQMKVRRMVLALMLGQSSAYSFTDGSGWVQVQYMVQILAENYKRYDQLRSMMAHAKNEKDYLRLVNKGLDNLTGLTQSLPIGDSTVLSGISNLAEGSHLVEKIYGAVPQSGDRGYQELTDQTIADAFRLISDVEDYAKKQDQNAALAFSQSQNLSPKGAARAAAQTNAEILLTLNQLLRLNGQILKVHSAGLALSNKDDKRSVGGFNRVNSDVKVVLSSRPKALDFPRF